MKLIKYQMLQTTIIDGAEQPQSEEYMSSVTVPYSAENEEAAKREAYKGEYEIFENGIPEPLAQPTLLDRLEAQLAYTAMMTDTLI
ncbi:MAG: hypothetical protein II230_08650 [Clostridia bacterium]|nr:hypothetical protein [Clostridia bacterium]